MKKKEANKSHDPLQLPRVAEGLVDDRRRRYLLAGLRLLRLLEQDAAVLDIPLGVLLLTTRRYFTTPWP